MVFVAEYSKAHMDHVHGLAIALHMSSTVNRHELRPGCTVHSHPDGSIDLILNRCKNCWFISYAHACVWHGTRHTSLLKQATPLRLSLVTWWPINMLRTPYCLWSSASLVIHAYNSVRVRASGTTCLLCVMLMCRRWAQQARKNDPHQPSSYLVCAT
jgi:hypothetical protein